MNLKIKDRFINCEISDPFKPNSFVTLRFLDKKHYKKYYEKVPQFFDKVEVKKEIKNDNTEQKPTN